MLPSDCFGRTHTKPDDRGESVAGPKREEGFIERIRGPVRTSTLEDAGGEETGVDGQRPRRYDRLGRRGVADERRSSVGSTSRIRGALSRRLVISRSIFIGIPVQVFNDEGEEERDRR